MVKYEAITSAAVFVVVAFVPSRRKKEKKENEKKEKGKVEVMDIALIHTTDVATNITLSLAWLHQINSN